MSSLLQALSIFATRVTGPHTSTRRLAAACPRRVSAGAAASSRPPTPPSSSMLAAGNVQHRQPSGLPTFPMVLMLNDVLRPEAADSSPGEVVEESLTVGGIPQDSAHERVELEEEEEEEEEGSASDLGRI